MTNILPDSSNKNIKLCRSDTNTKDDLYKKLISIEESDALARCADGDAKLFLLSCANIKHMLNDIHYLKSKNSAQLSDQVHEKLIQATSHVITLKTLNRLEKLRNVSARELCLAERDKTDAANFQYHNLMYEHGHLKSECTKFTSRFSQNETELFLSKIPINLSDLEMELIQQKKSIEECEQLQNEKKKIEVEILELQSRLDELAPKLNAVLESTKPLQEYFGSPCAKTLSAHSLALLLPNPLYLFFRNVDSYRRVYDNNIQVEICGNVNEAELKPKEDRKNILEMHPLSVSCTIAPKNSPTLTIMFHFCTELNIVTVVPKIDSFAGRSQNLRKRILSDENILEELFPLDFGVQSPNPDNEYHLEKIGVSTFHSLTKTVGFPYVWAQKVCGMEFLPYDNTKSRTRSSCRSIETVMKAIVRRLRSRTSLADQLQELEQNLLLKTPNTIEIPRTTLSLLFKWSPMTWEDYCQCSSTADLRLHGLVGPNDFFYCAVIRRNDLANLHAFIAIKSDYPIRSPIFSLTVKFNGEFHSRNCDGVRDLERSVNIMKDASNPRWFLSTQLHHLCGFFDVFLETSFSSNFAQKMMFFKNVCGRNRKRPFNFQNVGTGLFLHYKPSKD